MRLQDKVGIVTAGASGMGRAGSLRFAQEGASVAVVDLDGDAAQAVVADIKAAGGNAIAIQADLTNSDEARGIVTEAEKAFGGLDFVWNHVGHPAPSLLEGVDWAEVDLALDLNMRSVMVTTEAALPVLRARGGGSLLYTASISGIVGSRQSPIYSAAKFGVVGFVKAMSLRHASEAIRINAICPGPIDTPMLRVFVKRPDQQTPPGVDVEELIYNRQGRVPMGRPGQPEEVANAALFLLSDEASYITGVALPVDGGATAG